MEQPSNKRDLIFPEEFTLIPPPESFSALCAGYSLSLDEAEIGSLARFLSLLIASNEVVNLTAITDNEAAWSRHIFDAMTLLPFFQDLSKGAKIADVGSGGGVPAIPLAIACPECEFTLIESTGKKGAFLMHAAKVLGLGNVRVLSERAEDVGQDFREHRGEYDIVTARAVGRIIVTAELTAALLKVGGMVLLTKGEKAEEELLEAKAALRMLGLSHAGTHETPTGRIVALEKVRPTPRTYPRRPGEPKRAPIGSAAARKG